MKSTNRRGFLKTCAFVACLCGCNSIFKLYASNGKYGLDNTSRNDNAKPVISENEKNERFALQWIGNLLESLDESQLGEPQLRMIVKKASQAHHDLLNVPEMVQPFIGRSEEFIGFLEKEWGWKIEDDKANHVLIVDENKPFCVCPLLKLSSGKLYPVLCYCSEGFAEKMFSYVFQYPVSVRVAASVQRGDPSCIYRIDYARKLAMHAR